MNTRHQWQTTQERVDELTGKISVKKRDNESMFKKQQEAIEKNEGIGIGLNCVIHFRLKILFCFGLQQKLW